MRNAFLADTIVAWVLISTVSGGTHRLKVEKLPLDQRLLDLSDVDLHLQALARRYNQKLATIVDDLLIADAADDGTHRLPLEYLGNSKYLQAQTMGTCA